MYDQQLPLTAKSWILIDNATNQYWRGNNTMQKLEIASLTKMYTLHACLDINEQLNIKPELCWVQIVPSTENGTLAGLAIGKYLNFQQIYYALMLPSGNDAALNLAYYYGYLLGRKDRFPDYQWKNIKHLTLEGKKKYNRIYLTRFVCYMNDVLVKQKLGHSDTHFENPHGMADKLQRSTAWEISQAVIQFLKNKKFAKIVQTQKYSYTYSDGETLQWENTNILLKQGYIGVKTGHTSTAGCCLCSRKVIYHNYIRYDLILVVLGCKTVKDRFTETIAIMEDFVKYLKMMKK